MTFEEYVHLRGAALVRFARLLTGDDRRADELVRDVLAKAHRRWRRVMAGDRPDVYVRRMLVDAGCAGWWRRFGRRSRPGAPAAAATGRHVSTGDVVDPRSEAAGRDQTWRRMSWLPPRPRAVLVLRYYEELDDALIAEIVGCSPESVRAIALRALATLAGRPSHADPVPGSGW
ncbi:sigma factor-like helix-turn-helix DNA-binding protein [Plantactinospora sonchi]|uniref:Sigma factor-like helix-turn-helix DNA-binding protein n=1 Tax=Plantactinospora sonchi TaxID=1544735 RepID=A0ABU7S532_9ACTN